jgi:hypothetical protein
MAGPRCSMLWRDPEWFRSRTLNGSSCKRGRSMLTQRSTSSLPPWGLWSPPGTRSTPYTWSPHSDASPRAERPRAERPYVARASHGTNERLTAKLLYAFGSTATCHLHALLISIISAAMTVLAVLIAPLRDPVNQVVHSSAAWLQFAITQTTAKFAAQLQTSMLICYGATPEIFIYINVASMDKYCVKRKLP